MSEALAPQKQQLLGRLQRALEKLHGRRLPMQAADFCIEVHGATNETVLCRQSPAGELEVALCLARAPLERLLRDCPLAALRPDNVAAFCSVTEGVSHFLHLGWAFCGERTIAAIELEWLAELDKFCLASLLLHAQGQASRRALEHLFVTLFVHVSFAGAVAAAEPLRYRTAHRAAAWWCRQWLNGSLAARPAALVQALRGARDASRGERLAPWTHLNAC